MTIDERIASLTLDRDRFWGAVEAFVTKRDAHGVIDMAAEVQLVDRALQELLQLDTP